MRVYRKSDPTCVAYKRPYSDGRPAKYRAFPVGDNVQTEEQAFETEDELAYFLLKNPTWKALLKGPAVSGSHIKEIMIEGTIDLDRLARS